MKTDTIQDPETELAPMETLTQEEKFYNNLREVIFETTGLMLPEVGTRKSKKIEKIITDFSEIQFKTAKLLVQPKIINEEELIRNSSKHASSRPFVSALSQIMEVMHKRS